MLGAGCVFDASEVSSFHRTPPSADDMLALTIHAKVYALQWMETRFPHFFNFKDKTLGRRRCGERVEHLAGETRID